MQNHYLADQGYFHAVMRVKVQLASMIQTFLSEEDWINFLYLLQVLSKEVRYLIVLWLLSSTYLSYKPNYIDLFDRGNRLLHRTTFHLLFGLVSLYIVYI